MKVHRKLCSVLMASWESILYLKLLGIYTLSETFV